MPSSSRTASSRNRAKGALRMVSHIQAFFAQNSPSALIFVRFSQEQCLNSPALPSIEVTQDFGRPGYPAGLGLPSLAYPLELCR